MGKKGVVRDPKVHLEVIRAVMDFASLIGFEILHLEFSPIKGPEGNIEYLLHLKKQAEGYTQENIPVDPENTVALAHQTLDK